MDAKSKRDVQNGVLSYYSIGYLEVIPSYTDTLARVNKQILTHSNITFILLLFLRERKAEKRQKGGGAHVSSRSS